MEQVVWTHRCPMCQSDETISDTVEEHTGYLYVPRECQVCLVVWYDKYIFGGIDFEENYGDPLFI